MPFYNDAVNKNNNADKRFKGLCIHDLCAAVYVTDPQLFTTVKYQGDVETEGELTLGFTVLDYENIRQVPEEERNVTFISSVDRDGVLKIYFDALKCFGEQGKKFMDKIPVIIDCDTGIDDMISFVLTLASKQLDIRELPPWQGMYPFRTRRIIPSTDLHLWAEVRFRWRPE